jgi:hypothetical protein
VQSRKGRESTSRLAADGPVVGVRAEHRTVHSYSNQMQSSTTRPQRHSGAPRQGCTSPRHQEGCPAATAAPRWTLGTGSAADRLQLTRMVCRRCESEHVGGRHSLYPGTAWEIGSRRGTRCNVHSEASLAKAACLSSLAPRGHLPPTHSKLTCELALQRAVPVILHSVVGAAGKQLGYVWE